MTDARSKFELRRLKVPESATVGNCNDKKIILVFITV